MQPKPHVSPALSQLRSGVTGLAFLVAAAAVVQLLVFGFVHFTQIRWERPETPPTEQKLSVVTGKAPGETPPRPEVSPATPTPRAGPAAPRVSPQSQGVPDSAASARPDPRSIEPAVGAPPSVRTASTWNVVLRRASEVAVTLGVVCAMGLAIFTMLGVIVAGGAAVPGVQQATSACMWAVALALFAAPWHDVLDSVPFAGAFGSYDAITAFSEAVEGDRASAASLFGAHLVLPVVVIAVSMIVAARFRAGIDAGIIVTTVSELDAKLEQEMANIRKRGVVIGNAPRAVGALNAAIGEAISTPSPNAPREPGGDGLRRRPPDPDPAVSARSWVSANDRRVAEGDPGDPTKRPI